MEQLFVFLAGACGDGLIEMLWRGYTHWTMELVGGLCFLILYYVFDYIAEKPFIIKCLAGSVIITAVELISGIIINIVFSLDVWDYSDMPYNFLGQVCLFYSVMWFFLSGIIVYFVNLIKEKALPYLMKKSV